MKDLSFVVKGILAGILIGMGGYIYLTVGGVAGAVLFAFGLISVITLGLNLFTGKAQFVWSSSAPAQMEQGGYLWIIAILLLNLVGCWIMGALGSNPALNEAAQTIITRRLALPLWKAGALAIGCGIIMTMAVQSANKGKWLPLLFGIPAFILCGLPHCIADAFYIAALPGEFFVANLAPIASFYLAIVAGNFLGCNAYRLL
ncbi:MAG: formate/nitrite transporter family protein [Muribaculaceae bacterium]|nr:formate/nitrite transporter family protein [Muribaculaceae bacterium]